MNDDCKKIIPCLVCLIFITCFLYSNKYGVAGVDDIQNILPERARAKVMNEWLKWRLENILPRLMRRERIDMWLVINREYNEDPVYLTLVPEPVMAARRTSILVFFDRGEKHGIERLSGSFYSMGDWYQGTWKDKKKTQFQSLAAVIKKYNPRRIGINVSSDWAFGDGLTVTLKNKLERALDPKYASRLVSAERLCIGWLETRSPHELSLYRHVCGVAHDLIAEFFSNRVIIPDITTTNEVRWWIRQKINDIGFWIPGSIPLSPYRGIKKNPLSIMIKIK